MGRTRLRAPRNGKDGAAPHLIVGAGAKGLTLALALARRGEPVLVAEGSRVVGGLARSFHYGRFTFDFGLHAFVSARRAVRALAKDLLRADFREFTARAASLLPDGSLLEDSSRWCASGLPRSFHDLFPDAGEGWNCMRVSRAPRIVYPRRGGFGRLLERMAREIEARGGRILVETPIGPGDLEIDAGRVVRARLRGRWLTVRACHWTAGSRAPARRSNARADVLLLTHFMVRGRPSVPYHWVRVFGAKTPFLPQLVYYPARFAPANAPRGHHGVGAVVPLRLAPDHSRADARLHRWLSEDPRLLLASIAKALDAAGLMREQDVVGVRQERLPIPEGASPAARVTAPPAAWALLGGARPVNFQDCDRFYEHDPRESGVPLQMAAALRAARAPMSVST